MHSFFNVFTCSGFFMQLLDQESNTLYPYVGQWSSKEFSPVAEVLCIQLKFTALTKYSMYIDLVTGDLPTDRVTPKTSRSTIFLSNSIDATQLSFSTETSIGFQPTVTTRAQLVLYASSQMIINDIQFENTYCPETCKWIWQYCKQICFISEYVLWRRHSVIDQT